MYDEKGMNWGKNCTRAEICRNFKIYLVLPRKKRNLWEEKEFVEISGLVQFLHQGMNRRPELEKTLKGIKGRIIPLGY